MSTSHSVCTPRIKGCGDSTCSIRQLPDEHNQRQVTGGNASTHDQNPHIGMPTGHLRRAHAPLDRPQGNTGQSHYRMDTAADLRACLTGTTAPLAAIRPNPGCLTTPATETDVEAANQTARNPRRRRIFNRIASQHGASSHKVSPRKNRDIRVGPLQRIHEGEYAFRDGSQQGGFHRVQQDSSLLEHRGEELEDPLGSQRPEASTRQCIARWD